MTTAQGAPPRTLKIIAAITLALSAVPIAGGVYVSQLAIAGPDVVDVPTLMNRRRTSVGDFVLLNITPRLEDLARIESSGSDDYLLGAAEDPHLIVYAPSTSDLGEAVGACHPFAPGSRDACSRATSSQTVTGVVHDLDDFEHLTSELPGYLVEEHARDLYGEPIPRAVRVLEVGPSRVQFAFIGGASICTCGVPLLALALYALVRARKLERRPTAF